VEVYSELNKDFGRAVDVDFNRGSPELQPVAEVIIKVEACEAEKIPATKRSLGASEDEAPPMKRPRTPKLPPAAAAPPKGNAG
jgi:hypothetical protein